MSRGFRRIAAVVAVALATSATGVTASAAGAAGAAVPTRAKVPATHAEWPGDAVAGSLLVTATDDAAARALAASTHGTLAGQSVDIHVRPGEETTAAQRLRARRGVLAVEPDHVRHAMRVPNDPRYGEQWSHTLAHAPAAWDITTGRRDVTVAVIDTGVDGTHGDLRPNIVRQVQLSTGTPVEAGVGVDNDLCKVGHGTSVAGVVGAVGDNGRDVAGVAWNVGLVDIAVIDPDQCAGFSDSAIVAAIAYATSIGVDVMNLSLGGPGDTCPTAYQTAIDRARAAGTSVVAAAGNEQEFAPGLTSIPAACNGVIAVGAVGELGNHAPYSNANDWVDLAAPGGDTSAGKRGVLSTAPGQSTATHEGTSFSSPYVAGTIALMLAVNSALTPDGVESILESTANPGTVRSKEFGWGIVDVGGAVARAAAAGPVTAPRPEPEFPVGMVVRVSDQTGATDGVRQAVAVSRFVFPDGRAQHAVLARKDDFADALSGSSLAFGAGPVLFTAKEGPLDPTTADELRRILAPQGIVYVLGGTAALPPSIEDDIRGLGLQPRRIAGPTREATSAAVADEILRRMPELGFEPPKRVVLATAFDWPDAVTAGSLGAWFGYPILLTRPEDLSAATRDALARLHPERLYVVGGSAAISDAVASAASAAAGTSGVVRMAGVDRSATAVAVARQFVTDLKEDDGLEPTLAVGVNLRRADGYTEVLSASLFIGAFSGVFLPVEGDRGDNVPASVVPLACSLDPARGVVAGERDIVSDEAKQRLNALLEHTAPDCPPRP